MPSFAHQHSQRPSAPIYSFQWSPPDERDELLHAMIVVEAEALQPGGGRTAAAVVPTVVSVVMDRPDGAAFLEVIRGTLRGEPNVQLIYVSAHGLNGHALFAQQGLAKVPYQELGQALSDGLDSSSSVTAVFGMCEILADEKALLSILPLSISEALGFTGKPLSRHVAELFAGIVTDNMRLFSKASAANTAVFGAGVKLTDLPTAIAELERQLEAVVDAHDPEPEHFVDGPDGRIVRHYRRDTTTGEWVFIEALTVPGRRYAEPTSSAVSSK
jgi:hypothetical protein